MTSIHIHNNTFHLHHTGAIFWEEKAFLLIADVHLGKITHFRKHGSAAPSKAIAKNFELLNHAMSSFNVEEVYFLGDLFHSYINSEWAMFESWVLQQKITITLVTGNHDIIASERYESIGINVKNEEILNGFLLTHEPEVRENLFTFCGHIHPGIVLHGVAKQHLRLPCFFKQKNQLILPAFGVFTGLHIIEPSKEDQVFTIADDDVILVS